MAGAAGSLKSILPHILQTHTINETPVAVPAKSPLHRLVLLAPDRLSKCDLTKDRVLKDLVPHPHRLHHPHDALLLVNIMLRWDHILGL